MSKLTVFWDRQEVGKISRHPQGKIFFKYSPEWLVNSGKPISLSLPCREEKFAPGVSTAFFENLFPESEARNILALNHRFDKKDTFAFLENFGEDCAGALTIIPDYERISDDPGKYRCINTALKDALNLIRMDPAQYKLFPAVPNARLSIAGAQDKLPVYFESGDFYLPTNSASPTTHIVKPASQYFPDIQRNEAYCMELADQIDLPVPKSYLYEYEGHELFMIERYDRKYSSNTVMRVHQEDFCQAMGIPFSRKYQEKGGPSFLQCRELAEEHLSEDIPGIKERLTSIMTFNLLIGNNDAHAKNFSIIHSDQITLAPFYDLLSTQVYPALDLKLAMAIGETYRPERINDNALILFSKNLKLRPEKVFEVINSTIEAVDENYEALLADHEKKYGESKIYSSLRTVLKKNISQLQRLLNNILARQNQYSEDQDDGLSM